MVVSCAVSALTEVAKTRRPVPRIFNVDGIVRCYLLDFGGKIRMYSVNNIWRVNMHKKVQMLKECRVWSNKPDRSWMVEVSYMSVLFLSVLYRASRI